MAKKSNQPPASGAKAPSGKVKERDARTQAKIEARALDIVKRALTDRELEEGELRRLRLLR